MTLLNAVGISISFGSRTLFDGLTLTLDEGERVGLVGVNGSGKSTLMKVLAGAARPDAGLLQLRRGAAITYLPQEPSFPPGATVKSELSISDQRLRAALEEHQVISDQLKRAEPGASERLMEQLAAVSERIEQLGGWDTEHRARTLLDRLGVKDWDRPVTELSGGLRKRVAIARALLSRPDLLLLDEPTNHLDADTTDWLEEALDAQAGALLLVTHDRYFLDGLVDRIVEIGPEGRLTSFPGNYEAYLEQKLVQLEQQQLAQHKRERWIAQEVAWLRKGVEARRTKSKSRVERARKLLSDRGFRAPRVPALELVQAPRGGDRLIEAHALHKRFADRTVLSGVSLVVQRGERVGLVGPNGVGKTTFLRVLLGELPADAGERTVGKNTRIAYYDQARAQLDPEQTVFDSVAHGEEHVELGGKTVAIRDYLDDLLFPVPLQRTKIKALSGGERNRLLLARLFLEGANVLVLDEPTNDLDLVTLNVLERLLVGFPGAVLLVTHDRYFLDKVATAILAFEGDGKVVRYEGNYDLYRRLRRQLPERPPAPPLREGPKAVPPAATGRPTGRLSYKDQRELDGMEAAIEAAERRKVELEAALEDPEVYSNAARMKELATQLEEAGAEVTRLYERWQLLEAQKGP